MITEQLQARAFEIADESMLSLIECCCIAVDETGLLYEPVDDDGKVLSSVADAKAYIVEACEWVTKRGLGEIIDASDGQMILLYDEPIK